MNNEIQFPDPEDRALWEIAKKRASFKGHLLSYIVVNGFLWLMWAFMRPENAGRPWPIWPTLGWGIGLVMHFLSAYIFPRENSVENEFQKLKKQTGK
jgi:2TM domain